ncbi:hypothetical protein Droror1_Dr00009717 [Drosera rotundifolia]
MVTYPDSFEKLIRRLLFEVADESSSKPSKQSDDGFRILSWSLPSIAKSFSTGLCIVGVRMHLCRRKPKQKIPQCRKIQKLSHCKVWKRLLKTSMMLNVTKKIFYWLSLYE